MKVLITGADGFLGTNLCAHLKTHYDVELLYFTRGQKESDLPYLISNSDFIFHLAGVNRPKDPADYFVGNEVLTRNLCDAIAETNSHTPIIYTSSIQAEFNNPYGLSKRAAEEALFDLQKNYGTPVHVFRLPNIFGKWCKPNYNSAVATFCHNISRDLPIKVNDPSAALTLSYVDDVINRFLQLMEGADKNVNTEGFEQITPQYTTTVGEVVDKIKKFRESRSTFLIDRVGTGLVRALYATYLSYLPESDFSYLVPRHVDARGIFVEMLKTPDCGQFSYFTAPPGATRGGHYHHTKSEKFLVVKGKALFRFRHIQTNQTYELTTSSEESEIIETAPGWGHNITNIGEEEMVVMLWANEVFDKTKPDTFTCEI